MAVATQLSTLPSVTALPELPTRLHQHEKRAASQNSAPAIGLLKNCKTLNEVSQLHCHIIKTGLSGRSFAVANIVSACTDLATPGSLAYAQKVFEQYVDEEEDVDDGSLFVYNSLIRGYSQVGLSQSAVSVHVQMVENGLVPDKYTFPFLLSACTKMNGFEEGLQVHGAAVKTSLDGDVYVQNSLVHFYFECGDVADGQKVFDGMPDRNVVSWTSLICGYARRENPRKAVSLFFDMVDSGIRPNSVTMVCIISACSKLQDLSLGERVCAYINNLGLKLNTHMVNATVDMYMKCGAFGTAKLIFDGCEERSLVLYNTVMSNYAREGMAKEAIDTLNEMLSGEGPRPDRVTLLSAISACAHLNELVLGKSCHAYALRNEMQGWESILNATIDMYMKCGETGLACKVFERMPNRTTVSWNSLVAGYINNSDLESAQKIFQEMPERDLFSWNTMIGALVQVSSFEEAIELFRTMQREGIKPDRVTLVSVASACGYLGALGLAKWVHRYMIENQIHCDIKLSTAMVDMFGRCGDPQSAMLVFNNMKERDVSAWTAAIGAMAMEGNGRRAMELFREMIAEGVKPDEVLFVGLLTALSHGGMVEEGWSIFKSMEETYGISPSIVHCGCMVDLLGRAGMLEQALDFIKGMQSEPNDVIWAALLSACRKHNNLEMASYAAERLDKLNPYKSGISVLLSNIYASEGKWSDVAKVRLQMKEKGIQKRPGSSSVEISGRIHEFTSGDEFHPEMRHITGMLDEINCRLRDAGHEPDLKAVLLDVDEENKELLLSRHSEKLAIAYGLISTGHKMPIRVVKNLRICSDCHAFAKLVTAIYDREIIIRDNSRFHFFSQGLCSCGDYW
ncbi:hypothetical protein SAY86_018760 [Trapa natans]|uniref:DYW domain-containing protein n=1 Tax=Trapa natans TaxID=22666 RepID=A0AAN7LD99_TRANT|nr:hypothetical protein SAY86_018760 [Trapa natans]